MIETDYPDGTKSTVTYNDLGQKVAETDQLGRTTQYTYDESGQLTSVILPAVTDPSSGNTVNPTYQYTYDQYGNMVSQTDALGRVTSYTFDAQNRQLSETQPMGQKETQTYDQFGRLSTSTDFAGNLTKMSYDSLGRLTEKDYYAPGAQSPSESISYTFDPNLPSRIKTVTDPSGTTTYTYNQDGDLTTVATPEGTLHYVYDPATKRLTETYTTYTDETYAYDADGRLSTVTLDKQAGNTLATPEVTTYQYDLAGNRYKETLPNGDYVLYQYDTLNRLKQLTNYNSAGAILSQYTYTLGPTGRRDAETETRLESDGTYSTTTINWSYDNLDRLTDESSTSSVAGESYTDQFTYDLVGNRLTEVYTPSGGTAETTTSTYNTNDELTQTNDSTNGVTNYAYDANGSLISVSNTGTAAPESDSYNFDVQNHEVGAVINRLENGHQVAINLNMVYDADGLRVEEDATVTVDNGTPTTTNTYFLQDKNNPTGFSQTLEESATKGGSPTTSYTIGKEIIQQNKSGTESILLVDGQTSTRLLTDLTGAINNRFDYRDFGTLLNLAPGVLNLPPTSILFTGQWFDVYLLKDYMRARIYDPATGVFLSEDSYFGNIYVPLTTHKRIYAVDNPINWRDPSGHGIFALSITISAEGALKASIGAVGAIIVLAIAAKLLNRRYMHATIDYHYFISNFVMDAAIESEVNRIFQDVVQREAAPGATLTIHFTPVASMQALNDMESNFGRNGSHWDIGFNDGYTGPSLGQTGENSFGINPVNVRIAAQNVGVGFDQAVAVTIAHESGHHIIASSILHRTDSGYIDSRFGKVGPGASFSTEVAKEIVRGLRLRSKDV